MTISEILDQARNRSIYERKTLVKLLIDTPEEPQLASPKRRLSELRGLGKEIWAGIDAQEYVNQLRSEWDHQH